MSLTKTQILRNSRLFLCQIIGQEKYKITIKNETNRDSDVYVVDNIPTSFDEEIAIDVINTDDARYDKETGIANWNTTIPNGGSKEITVEYTVTYPENVKLSRARQN